MGGLQRAILVIAVGAVVAKAEVPIVSGYLVWVIYEPWAFICTGCVDKPGAR